MVRALEMVIGELVPTNSGLWAFGLLSGPFFQYGPEGLYVLVGVALTG